MSKQLTVRQLSERVLDELHRKSPMTTDELETATGLAPNDVWAGLMWLETTGCAMGFYRDWFATDNIVWG